MPSEPASEHQQTPEAGRAKPDSGHLDEDPEALEDPVHSGDAKHQHDVHQHDLHQHGHPQNDT